MNAKKDTIWTRNFLCIMLANLCLSLAHTSVNTLVSSYAETLGAAPVLIGMLTGIFFGIAVLERPFTGPLIPKYDNRTLSIIFYAVGIVAYAGYALTNTVGAFLVFRVVNGIQYGMVGVLNLTIASNSLPESKIGSGIGIFGLANSISQSFGPAIGAALLGIGTKAGNAMAGFRYVFLFATAVMTLALIPLFLLKSEKKTARARTSVGPWYKSIIAPSVLPATVMILLLMMSYTLYSAYLVPYARTIGVSGVSIFFTVSALLMLVTKPLSGRLSDKFGLLSVILPSAVSLMISFVIVAFARSLPMMLVGAFFTALGQGGTYPALQAMGIQCMPPEKRGIASNTLFFGIDLGFFLGPVLGSLVYPKTSYSTMYLTALIPCAALIAILFLSWPAFKRRRAELEAAAAESGDS
ncbi:MAG: MFS transporter [Oscillospiraceae bacterium]|nr:MFS transporter [Oscillospiraceae bacterium]